MLSLSSPAALHDALVKLVPRGLEVIRKDVVLDSGKVAPYSIVLGRSRIIRIGAEEIRIAEKWLPIASKTTAAWLEAIAVDLL